MIYKGANSSIELNILADLNQWTYDQMISAGFENVDLGHALKQ